MRRMFHGSGKIEFPGLMLKKISTLETLYLQIGRNRIFSHQNAENLLTRLGEKSHFQA